MGKIVYLMGKSSTGKDTIFKKLLEDDALNLKKIVPYTTRPRREDETEGVEYHFVSEKELIELRNAGRIIEERCYDTTQGRWYYFFVHDSSIDLQTGWSYIMIGTPEGYRNFVQYFDPDSVCPVLIEADGGDRLSRALKREMKNEKPDYAEICRRYLADEKDFSSDSLNICGIHTFTNKVLSDCIMQIKDCLKENIM